MVRFDACYITVFKSLRFYLSTLEMKDSVFVGVFGRFTVDDRRKRIKKKTKSVNRKTLSLFICDRASGNWLQYNWSTEYDFGLNVLGIGKSEIFVLNRVKIWAHGTHVPTKAHVEDTPPPPLWEGS